MKIDFHELARIEKQEVPPTITEHLQELSGLVNVGVETLKNLPAHVRSSQMRHNRLGNAIENGFEKSRLMYESCVFAKHLIDKRQQAIETQKEGLDTALSEHIPEHENALQKQLADATLSGDAKAADQAIAGLQKLRQRTEQRGEIENRINTMKALLDTFTLTKEVLTVIMGKISPALWRQHAESLLAEYEDMRKQITDFVELHHQIKACEWFGKDAFPPGYASPLQETVKLFEFDQARHKQAFDVLRPVVLPE